MLSTLIEYVRETAESLGGGPWSIIASTEGELLCEHYEPGCYDGAVNEHSLWPLYSATKSVAVAAILALHARKTIQLDDPVSKYLAAFGTPGDGTHDRREVTIRHLASNTSGVSIPPEKYTPEKDKPPGMELVQADTRPGQEFLYSTLGMHVLQNTIESATGEPFEDTLQTLVLAPLRLSSARYLHEYDERVPVIPVRTAENPPDRYYYSLRGLACNSGVYMTARDLNRYGQAWLSDQISTVFPLPLRKQAWATCALAEDPIGYGLMWWTIEQNNGYLMYGWGGQASVVVPEKGIVLTVLRNSMNHPEHGPFKYYEDKKNLVAFASDLG